MTLNYILLRTFVDMEFVENKLGRVWYLSQQLQQNYKYLSLKPNKVVREAITQSD